MAAYAALISLMNTMGNIQNHPRLWNSFDKNQTESLGEKVGFFLDFVESYNSRRVMSKEEAEDLESQIASAAHEAEDVIESHVVDHIHFRKIRRFSARSRFNLSNLSCLFGLQKVILDMDSIKEKLMKVKEETGIKSQQPTYSMPAASSRPLTTTGKTTMVGFDGYLYRLLDELTGQQTKLQVISITGMGGIGKSTLAQNVYESLLTVQHFDVRAWVTISQDYNVKGILLESLSCLRGSTTSMEENAEDHQLGEQLYKILSGRRYLVILDDMWSIEAWDNIKFFFPNNDNRSRILVTTRLSDVADHFGPLRLVVDFLDDIKSWDLFCEKAFAQEGCPPELEEIGKKIVKKCKGLPLSIVVIGGLLAKSSRAQEYWENISEDIISILNLGEDNQCWNAISLSYSHLPAHLKPCFLYLGIFSEHHEIRVSRLIRLWVAEGFIKPNKDQSLEEVAEGYIKDLVDRNLILVRCLGLKGTSKTCGIHDLLRDFCTRVAMKENFFYVMGPLDAQQGIDRKRRIIVHEKAPWEEDHPQVFHTLKPTSLTRSLICKWRLWSIRSSILLRVLSGRYVRPENLNAIFLQYNLRFLGDEISPISGNFVDFSITYKLPSSISELWNVQTIIITLRTNIVAPPEIWEMRQLRHFKCLSISLPDPPPSDEKDDVVLRNLQTFQSVLRFNGSDEVCKRMPNIKKLHIFYYFPKESKSKDSHDSRVARYCLYNVRHLNKLESLYLSGPGVGQSNMDDLLHNLAFLTSLKKLSLAECWLDWNELTLLGSLPHLEVLKLFPYSFIGCEWNPVEGQFLRLKYLWIHWCRNLIKWNAESSHFPVLEHLVLNGLWKLDEIPSGMGEIPTLKHIFVEDCGVSAAISAAKILEEQESLGNQGLQVRVCFDAYTPERRELRSQMKLMGLKTQNFQFAPIPKEYRH